MMVELAVGDAYGAGFEYVRDRRFITRHNDLSGYVKHPRHRRKPGTYTDDTQMSIAVAELVLEASEWTPDLIASHFLEVFHRDRREGYAGRFYGFLKKTKTAREFLANIRPDSEKSGAAMRACPIGVFDSTEEVVARCGLQASVTHDTPEGRNAAIAGSLMTHYFLHDLGPKEELPGFLADHLRGPWHEPWRGEVGSRGTMSVRAAITSVIRNDSLSSVLRSAIAWGGDTDTVATIALGAASCCPAMRQDLPGPLLKGLEDGPYGIGFLRGLDRKLGEFVHRQEDPRRSRSGGAPGNRPSGRREP